MSSMIVLHGHNSKEIKITQGVWQRCPLSPLLFNMTLESLAIAVRSNLAIEGIKVVDKDIKLGLYVDDVVCYLTNPKSSIKYLTQTLVDFEWVSGYKINQEKAILQGFNLSRVVEKKILTTIPCK